MVTLSWGKAGVPPATEDFDKHLQAGRLLYPLFRSLLRNMNSIICKNFLF